MRMKCKGQRHDAGEKLGFLKATVEFALKNFMLGLGRLPVYFKDLYRKQAASSPCLIDGYSSITVCVKVTDVRNEL